MIPSRPMICVAGLAAGVLIVAGTSARADLTFGTWTRTGDNATVVQFTAGSGSWTVPAGVSAVEVLVVGGGGGSGGDWSSGAGAGGLYYTGTYAVTAGSTLNVGVGDGGAAVADGVDGNNGSPSIFDNIIAFGGEGSLFNSYQLGGAQGGYSIDGGANVTAGIAGATGPGGGGGAFDSGSGAGAPGAFGNTEPGGIGLQFSITGTATYYAGGGGAPVGGLGGLGGGGIGGLGSAANAESNGIANTGGGAGGHYFGGSGSGGSGVVIVAYTAVIPVPEPSTIALTCCGAAFGAVLVRRRRRAS